MMNNTFIVNGVDVLAEIQRLKAEITHWSSLANEANERANEYSVECISLQEENERLKAENERLKQALEDVREIAYTTDFDIRDIQKIVNEVLKYE